MGQTPSSRLCAACYSTFTEAHPHALGVPNVCGYCEPTPLAVWTELRPPDTPATVAALRALLKQRGITYVAARRVVQRQPWLRELREAFVGKGGSAGALMHLRDQRRHAYELRRAFEDMLWDDLD